MIRIQSLSVLLFLMLLVAISAQAQSRGASTVLLDNSQTVDKKAMADKVKAEFLHAWSGYKKYAWGYDALQPLSKKPHNWYKKSLLMTPVDAFDTMILMDLTEEAKEAKELIFKELDFDVDMDVQNFEV